jgi:putative transposase
VLWGLIRNQRTGLHHFLTFSCWHRRPFFRCLEAREDFERSLEKMRLRYRFQVAGYVVMPEHVHLLVTEPCIAGLATAVQAIKLSVVKLRTEPPFWMPRYYDFVVPSTAKYVEKLRYIHLNPIRRGLVSRSEDWVWSSFGHYETGIAGTVEIESWWTNDRRRTLDEEPTFQSRDVGQQTGRGDSTKDEKPTFQNRDVGQQTGRGDSTKDEETTSQNRDVGQPG